MCVNNIYKTGNQFGALTIGILEEWNDGIMSADPIEITESITGIIIINGNII